MKKYIIALFLLCAVCSLSVSAQEKSSDKLQVDDSENYLILSTKKIQTMEKELGEAAAKGFRVLYGAPTQQFDMALFLTRTRTPQPFSYKIIATSRNKTMEKEINELAAQGYRILPRTAVFKQGLLVAEFVMIMERDPNVAKSYEYKLVVARVENKLQKDMEEVMKDGFQPVTMITIGKNIIVMEL
jgi:hypothetical protein